MSTPTPRTDAVQFIQHDMTEVVSADFARTLERELNAEREKAERYRLVTLRQDAELAAERARLDYLQEWGFDFLTRAAIDAAMKEGSK